MSALELMAVDVAKDLAAVEWATEKDASSMVLGKPTYWVIRDKYCPENTGSECFTGLCEFAKKYPGSGMAKPCLEYVRKIEAAKSLSIDVVTKEVGIV